METNIINFYTLPGVKQFMPKTINPNFNLHNISVPFRMTVVGASGAGKSNCVLNLISQMSNTFNHIYIFTKAEEPLYNYLQSRFDDDLLTIKYGVEELKKFDDSEIYGQSLMIFDDYCTESKKDQKYISDMYIRGRKMGCSSIYLTQMYFETPKIIRGQSNYIVILKVQQVRDLQLILKEFELGVTLDELKRLYQKCCADNDIKTFLTIDLQDNTGEKKFRCGFNVFLKND